MKVWRRHRCTPQPSSIYERFDSLKNEKKGHFILFDVENGRGRSRSQAERFAVVYSSEKADENGTAP